MIRNEREKKRKKPSGESEKQKVHLWKCLRVHQTGFSARLLTHACRLQLENEFSPSRVEKKAKSPLGVSILSPKTWKKSAVASKNSSATDKPARLMDFLQKNTSRPHDYLWEVLHSIQIRHRKPHFFTVTSIVPLA